LCQSSAPDNPTGRWIFGASDKVCVLWVEEGSPKPNQTLSIENYQNNQLLESTTVPISGNRTCRVRQVAFTVLGDYETKLIFGKIVFDLLWSIR
jgi:hypothetical protein